MMIPITRKEKYINEIVGGGDTAPETPQTREEFFFAAILGEVVAPSPITRVEKYLSAIAGQFTAVLPEPVTRIERFIARAAGMDVTIPTPITREKMLWANYALIVEKELSGIPPLTFNAIAGTLKNYRIYGNTVNGENVGDLITEGEHAGEYSVPVTVSNGADTQTIPIYLPEQIRKVRDYSDYIDYGSQKFVHRVVRKVFDGTEQLAASEKSNVINYFVPVITMGGAGNSINCTSNHISVVSGNENWANRRVPNAQYVSSFFQNNASQIRFVWNDNNGVVNLAGLTSQLSTWYANGDPLIVDYIIVEPVEEQVTLPALPVLPGTNTLTVGTEVQPSNVYIKYEGERQ